MKLTGPLAMPPLLSRSLLPRMGDRLTPAPEPYLKSMASVLARSMIEPMSSWTELMKQAEHCGLLLHADVEPDRRVEGHLLVHEQVRQLRLEGGEVLVRGEVVLRRGPAGDGVDDAIDELLDAALPAGRADVAAEVLADDDVGGELAPEAGDLDVRLLEDGLARLVLDLGGAELPGDLVVGVDAGRGPAALEGQSAGAGSGETPFVVDGPDDRLQGNVPRKHLGSVISRGVGCAGCCPGHFHTLPTLHIPFITGPGTAGAQSPNARFRPTRCQGQNHNM